LIWLEISYMVLQQRLMKVLSTKSGESSVLRILWNGGDFYFWTSCMCQKQI